MTTASAVCGSCGVRLLEGARFCHACGAPIAALHQAAEYKQVTVLFADVVRSMDVAAAVGAERLREIMTELVNRSSAVVRRYGGTVDKFTGDGVMAVFGAPVALEDHAFRACLAALDMQQEARRLATEVQRRDGTDLRLRVGLNSGEVIAGEVGSGPASYTAVGAQVGMAQRMESIAPPGGVMLSESTARLVENNAEFGAPELLPIKGAAEPVCARAGGDLVASGSRWPAHVASGRPGVGARGADGDAGSVGEGPWVCGAGGWARRYWKEPRRRRGSRRCRQPRRAGVFHVLRVARQRRPASCVESAAACGVGYRGAGRRCGAVAAALGGARRRPGGSHSSRRCARHRRSSCRGA